MPKSQPLVLILDADVVIECFRVSAWEPVICHSKVHIPSIIYHQEVQFFRSKSGSEVPINLSPYVQEDAIAVAEVTAQEQMAFQEKYAKVLRRYEIHDGEREALILLEKPPFESALVCSGDAAAIRLLAAIGLWERGISLEEILERTGHPKQLTANFRKDYFKNNIGIGKEDYITHFEA